MNSYTLLHLSLISGVGPGLLEKLLSRLPDSFTMKDLYAFTSHNFMQYGISQKMALKIVNGLQNEQLLHDELHLLEKHSIQWVSLLDDKYPEILKSIHLPPAILYYRGDLSCLTNPTVALVGARKMNQYGKRVAQHLIPELVAYRCTTVSGGAYGVDTVVHQETIAAGGKTVAVLGSGLLKLYPYENKKLFEKIVASGGLVMSSFSLNVGALPGNFPARNRIISGLSKGTVVIQAAQKSGALITADYALEQGRSVCAVPGEIDDPMSVGCHKLLKLGARLVTSGQDIIHELTGLVEATPQKIERQREITDIPELKVVVEKDPIVSQCSSPKGFEELLVATKMEESELKERLFDLQLEGKIEQDFAGLWYKV